MKATLVFNLPEDLDEHRMALDGAKAHLIIEDMFAYLRTKSKYEDLETLTIDEVREKLVELMEEYGVEV